MLNRNPIAKYKTIHIAMISITLRIFCISICTSKHLQKVNIYLFLWANRDPFPMYETENPSTFHKISELYARSLPLDKTQIESAFCYHETHTRSWVGGYRRRRGGVPVPFSQIAQAVKISAWLPLGMPCMTSFVTGSKF